jgi:hypothetical protein
MIHTGGAVALRLLQHEPVVIIGADGELVAERRLHLDAVAGQGVDDTLNLVPRELGELVALFARPCVTAGRERGAVGGGDSHFNPLHGISLPAMPERSRRILFGRFFMNRGGEWSEKYICDSAQRHPPGRVVQSGLRDGLRCRFVRCYARGDSMETGTQFPADPQPGYYRGIHHSEYTEPLKGLLLARAHALAKPLLEGLLDAIEAENRIERMGVDGWHYAQLDKVSGLAILLYSLGKLRSRSRAF